MGTQTGEIASRRGRYALCRDVAAGILGAAVFFCTATPAHGAEPGSVVQASSSEARLQELQSDLADVADVAAPKPQPKALSITATPKPRRRLTVFVDESGVPTLTNTPERFTNQPGYVELEIEYEPVVVPEQYRNVPLEKYTTNAIVALVQQFSRRYALNESLVYGIIRAESNFDPNAASPKGAAGLMQLMPATAAEMGIHDLFDPAENIAGGTQYLAKMLDLFDGDTDLALAAYNAGPQTVKNAGGIPEIDETKAYIERVKAYAAQFSSGTLHAEYRPSARGRFTGALPLAKGRFYTVHFLSGYTQPAEKVEQKDGLYILHFKGRVDAIKKELVTKIEKG